MRRRRKSFCRREIPSRAEAIRRSELGKHEEADQPADSQDKSRHYGALQQAKAKPRGVVCGDREGFDIATLLALHSERDRNHAGR